MIDDHAHPYSPGFEPLSLADLSLDVGQEPADQDRRRRLVGSRLSIELLTNRLASYLQCDPADAVAERDARAERDWSRWVSELILDSGITGLIVDGFGPLDTETFTQLSGQPVWELFRIEPLLDHLIGAGAGLDEILTAVDDSIAAAAERGVVGLKTVLAYRTGLRVDASADRLSAGRSLLEDGPLRRRAKPLRDLVFRRVLSRSADYELPLQIHTGYGDSDLRLAESNPLLLDDVLRTPEGSAAAVVLIHGSFPWVDELAYLCAVRCNVYAEISLSPLFSPMGTADRLLRLLDTAPADRVLLGTDGHGQPETHWFAAHVLQGALHQVRQSLRDSGARNSWLDQTVNAVLEGNARAVYHLDG